MEVASSSHYRYADKIVILNLKAVFILKMILRKFRYNNTIKKKKIDNQGNCIYYFVIFLSFIKYFQYKR